MGKNKRLIAIFVVLSIFLLPSVYALEIGDTFGRVWEVFWRLMQDSYVVYGFTFILFMTLLYAACAAALSRVGVFRGEGADGLSRPGRIVAFSIGALCTLGIFFFTRRYGGPEEVLKNVLAPFGIFGGLVIALVIFSLVYFGMRGEDGSRSWRIGLAAAALAMIVIGMVTSEPNIMSIGWMLALIAGIGALIGAFGHGQAGQQGGQQGEQPGQQEEQPGQRGGQQQRPRLDNATPGNVTVFVYDADQHPINNARVTVCAEGTPPKWFGHIGPRRTNSDDDLTDRDGKVVFNIGSGNVRIDVDASSTQWARDRMRQRVGNTIRNAFQPWSRGEWRASKTAVLPPNGSITVKVTVDRVQPPGEWIEPMVRGVDVVQGNAGNGLQLRGVIR